MANPNIIIIIILIHINDSFLLFRNISISGDIRSYFLLSMQKQRLHFFSRSMDEDAPVSFLTLFFISYICFLVAPVGGECFINHAEAMIIFYVLWLDFEVFVGYYSGSILIDLGFIWGFWELPSVTISYNNILDSMYVIHYLFQN